MGPDHPVTAQSVSNLGRLLQARGELHAARPLAERALVVREQVLGPDHFLTAMSLDNMARLLHDLSAEPMQGGS